MGARPEKIEMVYIHIPATVEQRELDYRSVPALKQTWKQGASWMAAHSSAYAKCLAQQCMSALSLTGQKLVLIDQYPGYQEKLFQINDAIVLAAKFQTELEQELSRSFEHAPVQNEPTKKNVGASYANLTRATVAD
jgi:hypothetical protein